MPRLHPKTQLARREHILDSAEACFVQAGFHATTMNDICGKAEISAGALYIYFSSKDDLIIGLCEREKERFSRDLANLSEASDFMAALQAMAEQYCFNEPYDKLRLHLEIGAEASRNAKIGDTVRSIDAWVRTHLTMLIEAECQKKAIHLSFPISVIVRAMSALGDGLFWHRALDKDFDPRPVLPAMMAMLSHLLNPIENIHSQEVTHSLTIMES